MQSPTVTISHPQDQVREYVSTVTPKGMVTIPQEVRRSFKIKPKEKVVFRATKDTLEIKPLMTLEDVMGSVPPLSPPKSLKQIREEVREERVNHYQAKMNS